VIKPCFLVVAALAMIASCSRPKTAPTVAARVVSLSPSTTETMYAIGAGALLVGRSRYCDYPPEVAKLPEVGGYVDPSFEAILGLRPDLVTGARGPAGPGITEKLGAKGIATFFPPAESFAQIDLMILGLGGLTDHVEQAKDVVAKIDAHANAIAGAVAAQPKARVMLVFGLQPIVAAGPKSFADEMLARAGGENVIADGPSYPTLEMERVLALDPDVILNAAIAEAHGAEAITADAPGWKNVRAVKLGRVVALTDEAVLRPGPRVADGLAVIARALHPDAAIP
jgi:iron complex transport system substrate-binding protein